MDDLITINTSDGHSLTVKRLHLLANSSVSADMMATLEQGNSVDFVETEKQRKPFLAALGGDLVGFEELDEEGLEDFAKLVDKYGFTFGEKMVRERLWRFVAEQDSFLHLFVLSTILNDEQLVHRLLPGTFSSLIEGRAASRVSPAWRDRIDAWRSLLQHHAARTYMGEYYLVPSCTVGCMNNRHKELRETGKRLFDDFDASSPFLKDLKQKLKYPVCEKHKTELLEMMSELESRYVVSAPPIPKL